MTLRKAALLLAAAMAAAAAGADQTIRGRFEVDLEPVSAMEVGVPYPLDAATAHRRALDEASLVFAGIVYGWRFEYAIGDKSRAAAESFELKPLGSIAFGDPRLSVTDADSAPSVLGVWAEYRLDAVQERTYAAGRDGNARRSQGAGSAPRSAGPAGKADALRDAARLAVRAVLGSSERNRPKEASGAVVLEEVPRYWVDAGRFVCSARFRVRIETVVPYRFF